ncbi:hypothetical protein WJX81_002654 [Elliptochloris bilobata]|uniref:DUF952 domain-containing protein n=1 Tax=Elliptochloris bilobata TaxID=381761 RepID=A0AAW1RGC2_9CHLO
MASAAQDGFIHLTEDPQALKVVFNHFYTAKEPWDWVCLVIDPAKLAAKVVYEPAAPVGKAAPPAGYTTADGPLFPHLYGTIDSGAVIAEAPLRRHSDGRFAEIDGVVTGSELGAHS